MIQPRVLAGWSVTAAALALAAIVGDGDRPSAIGLTTLFALFVLNTPFTGGERDLHTQFRLLFVTAAACLPAIGAAFALDVARGIAAEDGTRVTLGFAAVSAVWGSANALARAPAPRVVLLTFLFGPPLVAIGSEWVGGAWSAGVTWPTAFASWSPLGWGWATARALPGIDLPSVWPCVATGAIALGIAARPPSSSLLLGVLLGIGVTTGRADAGEERVFRARFEVEGPVEALVVEVPGGGRARLEVSVPEGSRRSIEWPLPVASRTARDFLSEVEAVVEGGGAAEFTAWLELDGSPARVDTSGLERPPAGAALPPGLAARPRPEPKGSRAGLGLAVPLLLVSGLVLTVAIGRRRPFLSWLPAGALALVLGSGVGIVPVDGSTLQVLELDWRGRGDVEGLWVRSARDSIELAPGDQRVEVSPSGAPIEVQTVIRGDRRLPAVVSVSGGRVDCLRREVFGELRTVDELVAELLARGFGPGGTATRSGAGVWTGGDGLPAWVVAGLPTGRPVRILLPLASGGAGSRSQESGARSLSARSLGARSQGPGSDSEQVWVRILE